MDKPKRTIKQEGAILIENFITGDLLKELQEHADNTPPYRGQRMDKKWLNEANKELHPDTNEGWSHYWTEQIGTDPAIINILSQLTPLVNNILNDWTWWCVDYHVVNPGCEYIRAHADIPHIFEPWRNVTGLLGLQVIVTVDDFTIENGCTCYLPKSHDDETLDYSEFSIENGLNDFLIRYGKRLEVPAGSILAYHPRTLHSMMPNYSDEPRRALLLNAVEYAIVDQLKKYDTICWPENMVKKQSLMDYIDEQ